MRCFFKIHKYKKIDEGTQPFITYRCIHCGKEKYVRDYSVAMHA